MGFNKYYQTKTETKKFAGTLKPLMTEAEKQDANVQQLSFDYACRITRLYKFLNEGHLAKADRDIIEIYGKQIVRSATSINANLKAASKREQWKLAS